MEENIWIILTRFLLIFIRCLGFFMVTPIFGRREYPAAAKIGLSALLSLIIYPTILGMDDVPNTSLQNIFLLVLRESAVGLTLGYVTLLLFSALYIAGELVDTEMGFGIVNVIDPQSRTQVPLTGNFYYMLAIMVFLCINGHHHLIGAIIKSFERVPLGEAVLAGELLQSILFIFGNSFIIGIKVALPIVAMIFLTDFALGIIARTVPQMNVFIVGLPIKIFIGIWGMIIVLPMFFTILDVIFNATYDSLLSTLQGMWPKP